MQSEHPDDRFKVMKAGDMFKKYYSSDEQPPVIKLNPENVPPALRDLVLLAEKWGISDDLLRGKAVDAADKNEIEQLRHIVSQYNHELDQWLAGPESYSTTPSQEYLAFSNMRMAADGC